jgi:ADP-heptose:LPS heptosyltransferase
MGKRPIKKICVIRLSSLGDLIQASASVRALRNAFPDARITFVVAKGFEEPISKSPIIDDLIIYDRGGKNLSNSKQLVNLILNLMSRRFDLLVDLHTNKRSRLISFFSFPRYRTPVLGNFNGMPNLVRHEFFLKRLGIDGPLPLMESWVGDDDIEFADKFLDHASITSSDFLVGLNPGVNWTSKTWPPEFFAEVGDHFTRFHSAKTIVFGGPADREKALNIYRRMEKKPILAAGRTSFLQAGALIKRCSLFITGDTGLMHMARGFQIPTVAIFGGTDPKIHTDPLPPFMRVLRDASCQPPCYKYHCPKKTRACLWAIRPEMVITEAEDLLGIPTELRIVNDEISSSSRY